MDLTGTVKSKGNILKIRVWDATDNSWQPRGKQVNEPQGIWYTPVTGIWQTVWLEGVPQTSVESYYAVSDIKAGTFSVEVKTAGLLDGDEVKVDLLEGGIGYSAETPASTVVASASVSDGKALINVPDMKLWSPDSPYLYGLKVSILRGGKVIDSVDGYTAAREISVCRKPKQSKRMALNGEELFHFGPLDQG